MEALDQTSLIRLQAMTHRLIMTIDYTLFLFRSLKNGMKQHYKLKDKVKRYRLQ